MKKKNKHHSNHQTINVNSETVFAKPLEVKVIDNNFDRALRIFRSIVQKEKVLSLYKEKRYYEKPSDKRRRKANERRRKAIELEMKLKKREKELKDLAEQEELLLKQQLKQQQQS